MGTSVRPWSTDVSRYQGHGAYEQVTETQTAGVTIQVSQSKGR